MTAEYIWPWAGGLSCAVEACKGDVTHRVGGNGGPVFCSAHLPAPEAPSSPQEEEETR